MTLFYMTARSLEAMVVPHDLFFLEFAPDRW